MLDSDAHILIIGGTGMLSRASQYFAQYANVMTVIARTPESLGRLRLLLEGSTAKLHLVAQDYNDKQGFSCTIDEAVRLFGVPEKALVWMHTDPPAYAFAEQLSKYGKAISFFHVLSSESANPASDLAMQRKAFDSLPPVTYHQIVLGFMLNGERSRWLVNEEISAGVISAINAGLPSTVVGVVRPWSARPA